MHILNAFPACFHQSAKNIMLPRGPYNMNFADGLNCKLQKLKEIISFDWIINMPNALWLNCTTVFP